MEPIKLMPGMKPMDPMTPKDPIEAWWPSDLGRPSSSDSQNGMRYAFFADAQRLLIERAGMLTTYDYGRHRINVVSQQDSQQRRLTFNNRDGPVDLESLREISYLRSMRR